MKAKFVVQAGDTFGKWATLVEQEKDNHGHKRWLCRCGCGTERVVLQYNLTSGNSKDCGCGRIEKGIARLTTHGRSSDPDYDRTRAREYRRANIGACRERESLYVRNNPHKVSAKTALRRARKLKAVPHWDQEETKRIFEFYRQKAAELYDLSGTKYVVDHAVPLHGKANGVHVVCGLHTKANLQLLSDNKNAEKSCYSWPDMWDYSCYNELLTLQEQ